MLFNFLLRYELFQDIEATMFRNACVLFRYGLFQDIEAMMLCDACVLFFQGIGTMLLHNACVLFRYGLFQDIEAMMFRNACVLFFQDIAVLPQCLILSKLFGFLTLKFSVWIFINKCLDFSSLGNCLTFHISDHVLPISKPLSVVLAECSHFVVTCSVQEYSCCHLVCAGILPAHSPVLLCGHQGLCRNMPAEPEPFDLCACSCMSYLVGYLKPDLELESFTVSVRES